MPKPKSISYEETETIIRTDRKQRQWDFWTNDKSFIARLSRLGYKLQNHHQAEGKYCLLPRNRISIRPAVPKKLSEKQLKVIRDMHQKAKKDPLPDLAEGPNAPDLPQ